MSGGIKSIGKGLGKLGKSVGKGLGSLGKNVFRLTGLTSDSPALLNKILDPLDLMKVRATKQAEEQAQQQRQDQLADQQRNLESANEQARAAAMNIASDAERNRLLAQNADSANQGPAAPNLNIGSVDQLGDVQRRRKQFSTGSSTGVATGQGGSTSIRV